VPRSLANRRFNVLQSALAPLPRRQFTFQASVGVAEAALSGGAAITGKWRVLPETMRVDSLPKFLEDFANWSTEPDQIVRFTKEYAPLVDGFKAGGRFRFTLADWRRLQAQFRKAWDALMDKATVRDINYGGHSEPVAPGESFDFGSDEVTFCAASLHRLLILELHTQQRQRLRKCPRSDCPNPYFIAARLHQRYCSEPCAQWAQRQEKLAWWNRVGKKERAASQKPKRRG
jgi:hypothetical protein